MVRVGGMPGWGERRPDAPPTVDRFEGGVLPAGWDEVVGTVAAHATALLKVAESLATQLKTMAREEPSEAARCAQLYSRIGGFAPRLQHAQETADLWLQTAADGQPPLAKWLEAGVQNGLVTLTAHACPLQPGHLLRSHLWRHVRGAVVTSASLTTCGGFEHFLHESGLAWDDAVATRQVQSPFDHARQGRLVVVQTQADPKDVDGYTREMLDALMTDLQPVRRGALVLFTSRAQMAQARLLLERGEHRALRDAVLVQGDASRTALLRRHAQRVADGEPSILFGLQSFGEGLDLPGELCEWVFITKLPFASPADPVGQARADWLRSQGRDPFSELVVPATGARLLQWTGRALRSETDEAVVVCYDAPPAAPELRPAHAARFAAIPPATPRGRCAVRCLISPLQRKCIHDLRQSQARSRPVHRPVRSAACISPTLSCARPCRRWNHPLRIRLMHDVLQRFFTTVQVVVHAGAVLGPVDDRPRGQGNGAGTACRSTCRWAGP